MPNDNLSQAKKAKYDEFYTQYSDIEKEMSAYLEYNPDVFRGKTILLPCDDPEWSNFTKYFAQNFDRFGLKKLISTSYAVESKTYKSNYQPTLFEKNDPQFDEVKTSRNGKIFTLTSDRTGDQRVDVDDLEWRYLQGDGDFRSEEVQRLRDESDIIITNPPFSMFREFLAWIMEAAKQFVIIGNLNAITYKEVFPLIKNNEIWLGNGFHAGNAYFFTPFADTYGEGVFMPDTGLVKFRNVCWFTNLDHGRRHQPLPLMTMADNLRFSKHKEIKGRRLTTGTTTTMPSRCPSPTRSPATTTAPWASPSPSSTSTTPTSLRFWESPRLGSVPLARLFQTKSRLTRTASSQPSQSSTISRR